MGKSTVKKILIAVFSSVCAMCIFGAISALFNRDACLFHEWDDGVVIKANTCKDEGEIIYTCYECGEEKAEVLAASARSHVWDSGTVTVEPVCETVGEKTYTCEVCGEEKTEKLAYPGHSYGTGVITQAATCTVPGIMQWTCSVCGDQTQDEVAALGGECVDESDDAVCDVCNSVIPLKEGTYTEVAATVGETVAGNWYRMYFAETTGRISLSSKILEDGSGYSTAGNIMFTTFGNNMKGYVLNASGCLYPLFKDVNGISTCIIYDDYVDIYIHVGQLTQEELISGGNLTVSEPVTEETTITDIYGEVYRLDNKHDHVYKSDECAFCNEVTLSYFETEGNYQEVDLVEGEKIVGAYYRFYNCWYEDQSGSPNNYMMLSDTTYLLASSQSWGQIVWGNSYNQVTLPCEIRVTDEYIDIYITSCTLEYEPVGYSPESPYVLDESILFKNLTNGKIVRLVPIE